MQRLEITLNLSEEEWGQSKHVEHLGVVLNY